MQSDEVARGELAEDAVVGDVAEGRHAEGLGAGEGVLLGVDDAPEEAHVEVARQRRRSLVEEAHRAEEAARARELEDRARRR